MSEVEGFSDEQAKAELDRLHDLLSAADTAYFDNDAPDITDAEYDAMKRRYVAIETAFPSLKRPDSLTEKVAGTVAEGFAKIRHRVPMLSLAKAYTEQDVVDFVERAKRFFKADANLAEAHYNLALSLDKMGKHEDATGSFKKAAELAPTNPAIKDSPILKKHLGM